MVSIQHLLIRNLISFLLYAMISTIHVHELNRVYYL